MAKKTKQGNPAAPRTPGKDKTSQAVKPALTLVPDLKQLLLTGPTNQAMETLMTKSKTKFDKFSQDASVAGRDGVEAVRLRNL